MISTRILPLSGSSPPLSGMRNVILDLRHSLRAGQLSALTDKGPHNSLNPGELLE